MCFNPSPVRRVPSPNRYMAVARFCFCKNNKRTIDRDERTDLTHAGQQPAELESEDVEEKVDVTQKVFVPFDFTLWRASSVGKSVCFH
jgi:hypothetical protein